MNATTMLTDYDVRAVAEKPTSGIHHIIRHQFTPIATQWVVSAESQEQAAQLISTSQDVTPGNFISVRTSGGFTWSEWIVGEDGTVTDAENDHGATDGKDG